MIDRTSYSLVVAATVVGVCLQLFFLSRGFYSIGWDESGRILDARDWAVHGIFRTNAWLPFYRVIVGLGLTVYPDLVLTPRFITFLFGLASIPMAGWLAYELFQDRRTTLLALILGAFFPQRVVLSLAPLSDIMLVFMILVTISLWARWLRTYKGRILLSCGLCGALATTIRYEAWVFAAVVFLATIVVSSFAPKQTQRDVLLLFGLTLFLFPAVWALSTFSAVNPVAVVAADAKPYPLSQVLRKNPLVEFGYTNVWSLNVLGSVAVLQFIRRGHWRHRTLIAVAFSPLLITSLVLLLMRSAQTGPSWRMIAAWSMLLMPYTACLLVRWAWPSTGGRANRALAVGATALVFAAFVHDIFRIERDSSWAFPESDRQAGRYLRGVTDDPDKKVLIESSGYFFLNVLVASQHPDAFVRNSVPERQSVPVLPLKGVVRDAVEARGVRFLVFRAKEYKDLLDRSPEVARVQDFGPWSIYEVK